VIQIIDHQTIYFLKEIFDE